MTAEPLAPRRATVVDPAPAGDLRQRFEVPAPFTVGIEDEVLPLDPVTLALAPFGPELVAAAADPAVREEVVRAQLELTTPVCATAADAGERLGEARRHLVRATAGAARFAGSGTHPTAPATGATNPADRYAEVVAEFGWAVSRALVAGLHVHVCLRGADRVLAVHDALRSYLPDLAALAGNAPFLAGEDTGLASVRPKLAEALPRQGLPPAFRTWDEHAALLAWGARSGAVPDARSLWWEVRLHPVFATIELRVPDAQPTVAAAAALAAVARALVADLAASVDDGDPPPVHDTVRIDENRWRALRHGLPGTLLDLETGDEEPTRARVGRLLDRLAPTADALGDSVPFAGAADLLRCSGAERQRAVAGRHGLPAVVEDLADRFLEGCPDS